MIESFVIVAKQVGMLALMMSVGYMANHCKLLAKEAVKGIVDLLLLVVAPCLIVTAFQRPFSATGMKGAAVTFAMSILLQFTALALALTIRNKNNKSTEGVLRFAVLFSNAGFMGLPLNQALLGDEGVFYGAIYVCVFNLAAWTMGLAVMCGNFKELSPSRLIRNPGLVGIALGLPFFLTSTRLPSPVYLAVKGIGDLNTPLAMITIGYYLREAKLGTVLKNPLAYWTGFLRLFGVSAVFLPILWLVCRDWPMPCVSMAIVTAAPVAAVTTMFAARYGKDVDTSVGIVAATTILSIATMPFIVGFAIWLFGV